MSDDVTNLAEVLAAHYLSSGGRNLGQWRTEWTCACGATLVTDGHTGPSLREANHSHLAEQIAPLIGEARLIAATQAKSDAIEAYAELVAGVERLAKRLESGDHSCFKAWCPHCATQKTNRHTAADLRALIDLAVPRDV